MGLEFDFGLMELPSRLALVDLLSFLLRRLSHALNLHVSIRI